MNALTQLRLQFKDPDAALRRYVVPISEFCKEERNAMAVYMETLLSFAYEERLRVDTTAKDNFAMIRNQYRDILNFIANIDDNLRIFLAGNFGLRNILLGIQKNIYVITALMNCRRLYLNLLRISSDAGLRALVLHIDDLFDGPFSTLEGITNNLSALMLVLKNWNKITDASNIQRKKRSIDFAIHHLFELQSTNETMEGVIEDVQTCLLSYLQRWGFLNTIRKLIQTICLITVTVALTCCLWILFWLGHNFNTRLPSMKRAPSFQAYVKETMVLYACLAPLVYLFYVSLLRRLTDSRMIAISEIDHYLETTENLKAAYLKIKEITEKII